MKKTNNVLKTSQKIYIPFKGFFDFLFSFIAIIVLIPLFFVLSIVVLIDTHGFPVFRQKRIGKNNKEFLILKFRTMNVKTPRDVPTHLLENPDQYITKCGRWMRKSSLDELPQLFNILIGQMSFIGPRPALWNQKDLIDGRTDNNVQIIRPGLTGWAQVNGRDTISIEDKIKLDEYYLKHFNILFDIKIFFISVIKSISRKDVVEGKQG